MLPYRNPLWWHLALIVSASVAFESLFIHHGIGWLFDEGWPLYAAMQLKDGAVLYQDVVFPFPPGHLFPAWVAYSLDPPGIILARWFYATFCVALNLAVYFLGRRITTPTFALLAALLLVIAAPRSHLSHLVFGYRYLLFAVCVLLAFAARLRARDAHAARRWMFVAGLLAGVALVFRLTPAFAVSVGVGLAVIAASRDWRDWLRDWMAYAAGLLVVAAPAVAWFAATVGLETLWREVVVRPVVMTRLQSLPMAALEWLPESTERGDVYRWFVGVQYRAYIVLYAGYAVALFAAWLKATRERRAFEHPLLLALVVAGAIYFLRAFGRSDDHHLMSALPPVCLVLAHGAGVVARRLNGPMAVAVAGLVLSAWAYLMNVDSYVNEENRGIHPLVATDREIRITRPAVVRRIDLLVDFVGRLTEEGDVMLDVSGGPLLYSLTGRRGPGTFDVITPGIFLTAGEERRFVDKLRENPPAAIIWPVAAFDRRADRRIEAFAPELSAWVRQNYFEAAAIDRRYKVLGPLKGVRARRGTATER